MGFGVQALRSARRALGPDVPIVFTLHEYLPICANHGQMIKARSGALCSKASPSECGVCFPEIGPANLMRRELFLKSFLAEVDAFVSPSRFLLGRFADWGLPREKLVMIENGLDGGPVAPAARHRTRRPPQPLRLLRPAQPLQGHPRPRRRRHPHPGRGLGRLDPLRLRRQPRAPARRLPGRGQGALPPRRPPPALHGLLQVRRPARPDARGRLDHRPLDLVGERPRRHPGGLPPRPPDHRLRHRRHGREGPRRHRRPALPRLATPRASPRR